MIQGPIQKLKSSHQASVKYTLPLGDHEIDLNSLVGSQFKMNFTGQIFCKDTGKLIRKSYGQGYSWESFITLPECDQCIVQPELCHYARGTCRDSAWGEKHCLQPHIIYLSLTSGLKVGITRKSQVPTRWIDQGAVAAIKLGEVSNRLTSGLVEVEIAKKMADKTNWRNMLKNQYEEVDLLQKKQEVWSEFSDLFARHEVQKVDDEVFTFEYPVMQYPQKVSSYNFDKNPLIEDKLMGIKGQYLIFEHGVINMRKYQGYEIEI